MLGDLNLLDKLWQTSKTGHTASTVSSQIEDISV